MSAHITPKTNAGKMEEQYKTANLEEWPGRANNPRKPMPKSWKSSESGDFRLTVGGDSEHPESGQGVFVGCIESGCEVSVHITPKNNAEEMEEQYKTANLEEWPGRICRLYTVGM